MGVVNPPAGANDLKNGDCPGAAPAQSFVQHPYDYGEVAGTVSIYRLVAILDRLETETGPECGYPSAMNSPWMSIAATAACPIPITICA